jgi:hypothetical protein
MALVVGLVACAVVTGASRDDVRLPKLSFETAIVAPGTTSMANVTFEAGTTPLAGLQFDLEFDHDRVQSVSPVAGDAAVVAEKSVTSAVLEDGRVRIIVFGFNANTISSGTIANLGIQMRLESPPGATPVRILNVVGVSPAGEGVSVVAEDGRVFTAPPVKARPK